MFSFNIKEYLKSMIQYNQKIRQNYVQYTIQ